MSAPRGHTPRPSHAAAPELDALGFTSDRLRLLGPLVTPRAIELARQRIIDPKTRLVGEKGAIAAPDTEATIKIALLILRTINPVEWLTNEEEALMRGITAATYAKRREIGEI